MRPTMSSSPSIFTLRTRASRTRSSLLLATRRTKKFILSLFGFAPASGVAAAAAAAAVVSVLMGSILERLILQHVDHVKEVSEDHVDREQEERDQEHERDHDFRRADQVFAARPVHLLHLAVGRDKEVGVARAVH